MANEVGLSKQALGGVTRARKAKFMSNVALLEDRFRLHGDESARIQRLADVVYQTFRWDDICSIYQAEHEDERAKLTAGLAEQMQQEANGRSEGELTKMRAAHVELQRLHAATCAELAEIKAAQGPQAQGSNGPEPTTHKDKPAALQHTKVKEKLMRKIPKKVAELS
jgi:hypothetical protein